MDPESVRVAVISLVFVVAGVDVGIAFLMRATHESVPERD